MSCLLLGDIKSLHLFQIKTGAPSHANFREIQQGGYAKESSGDKNTFI